MLSDIQSPVGAKRLCLFAKRVFLESDTICHRKQETYM